ncbi:MAG: glycosyltransferase family 1 protein [Oscillatoriophycideae cyanobacterium NC_groundwater_1537_Pr4_S-0.65um_50_18]|nr:glycosyltransferase family 1 protein [Oscillatoriophycideae cyanobacterium NC_groundwater_1537_Pr4_S-0.65um_50_18]
MNLFVLSELHPSNKYVGWSVSYDLEETLATTCNPTFIYPSANNKIKLSQGIEFPDDHLAFLRRYRHRIFKSWFEIENLPTLGKGCNVLLIIGLQPQFLLSMHALGPLLQKFDLRLGYVLDGFDPQHLDKAAASHLDHLFVMSAEIADAVDATGMVKTSFLPLAANVLRTGGKNQNRWIDIIAYGRGNLDLHRCLQTNFNQHQDGRVYFHSTFSRPEVDDHREHITLLSKLLDRSKLSLCFEASNIPRFMGYSPILYRWYEAWASGCTIVGKKPFGKGTAELMDWENSVIDIPDAESDWIPFFEDILNDSETLALNVQRNYRESLLRHDWRYRIRQIFETVGLESPETLNRGIAHLEETASGLATPLKIYA